MKSWVFGDLGNFLVSWSVAWSVGWSVVFGECIEWSVGQLGLAVPTGKIDFRHEKGRTWGRV